MEQEMYVSTDTAKLLTKKGFDFNNPHIIVKPQGKQWLCTKQTAMQWLREEHNLSVEPYYYLTWRYCIKTITDLKFVGEGKDFDTYYQAAEASIKYCLENLI